MTIDKIKHYMSPVIFNHWASVRDIEIIARAEQILSREIENKILVGVQYHAELYLLRHLMQK